MSASPPNQAAPSADGTYTGYFVIADISGYTGWSVRMLKGD